MIRFLLSFVLSLITSLIHSQELVTDRPDQTESSSTVPHKSFQWESGFSFETDNREELNENLATNSFGLNHSLLRYGISRRFELRLGLDVVHIKKSYNDQSIPEEGKMELEPVYFGAKLQLTNESGIIPELGLISHIAIPVSDGKPAMNELMPDILLAGSYSLTDLAGLGFNFGLQWPDLKQEYPDLFYSAVLGISLNQKIATFWEIYGYYFQFNHQADLRADAGITYLVKPNFQLDLSAGLGISESSPDFFVGLGFSLRIPE